MCDRSTQSLHQISQLTLKAILSFLPITLLSKPFYLARIVSRLSSFSLITKAHQSSLSRFCVFCSWQAGVFQIEFSPSDPSMKESILTSIGCFLESFFLKQQSNFLGYDFQIILSCFADVMFLFSDWDFCEIDKTFLKSKSWRQFGLQCMRFFWTGLFRYFFVCLDCWVDVIIRLFKIQSMVQLTSSTSCCRGILREGLFWDCWLSYFRYFIDGLTDCHACWQRNDFSGFDTWTYFEVVDHRVYTRTRLMAVMRISSWTNLGTLCFVQFFIR